MKSALCQSLLLYLVLDPDGCSSDPEAIAQDALRGGATALQLRSKTLTDRQTLDLAARLASLCKQHGALFLVNDRLDLALASGAQGVHLGVDDLPLAAARRIAGAEFIIGYSPENDEQAAASAGNGADYLGVGPVYGTASKSDAGPPIGLETLTRRRHISGLPVVGIGGITAANAKPVVDAGACGVAVMSAITRSADPESATRAIADTLREVR